MSEKIFTDKEVKRLLDNPNVKSASKKAITYSDEFKRIFIVEKENGKFPSEIFEEHGFDIDVLGLERVRSSAKRWQKSFGKGALETLRDTRKGNSGRPSDKELSLEEKYERQKAEINLLKAENELLKKLEMAERRLKKKI